MKGFFVVLEGLDGSGKSTQAKMLAERLRKEGRDVEQLREPTQGRYGQEIRRIAEKGRVGITPEEELELFVNDRAEDVMYNILPCLKKGKVIVMDRYYYSNIAYQGALGVSVYDIKRANAHFPKPHLTVFVDVPPEKGLERIAKNREGGTNEGYEKEEFLRKVYKVYKELAYDEMETVDGTLSPEEVHERIYALVDERIFPVL